MNACLSVCALAVLLACTSRQACWGQVRAVRNSCRHKRLLFLSPGGRLHAKTRTWWRQTEWADDAKSIWRGCCVNSVFSAPCTAVAAVGEAECGPQETDFSVWLVFFLRLGLPFSSRSERNTSRSVAVSFWLYAFRELVRNCDQIYVFLSIYVFRRIKSFPFVGLS